MLSIAPLTSETNTKLEFLLDLSRVDDSASVLSSSINSDDDDDDDDDDDNDDDDEHSDQISIRQLSSHQKHDDCLSHCSSSFRELSFF